VRDLDTFDRSGMWINLADDGSFAVVDVTKGAPAAEAGLRPGDEITAVNGRPTASLKLYDVRQMLRDEPAGTKVTLSVKRDSQASDVTLTLRDLI